MNAANAGDCWRKRATMCMVASGNQTRDMMLTTTTNRARCGKQSPWTTRKPLFGRMNRFCQTRIRLMSQQLPPSLQAPSSSRRSMPAAAASGAVDSNAARRKTIRCPQSEDPTEPLRESHRGGLWFGLSLVVAFFCLFQALPRWSHTDGLQSARTRHGVAPLLSTRTSPATTASARDTYKFFNIEDIRAGPTRPRLEPRHRPT